MHKSVEKYRTDFERKTCYTFFISTGKNTAEDLHPIFSPDVLTKLTRLYKMPRNVLVIEDEKDIANLLQVHLQDIECEPVFAFDGVSGCEQALKQDWDLIILDLKLPGMDGLEICRRVRAKSRYIPILMLTAKSTELDRVLGLEIGADDYLTKPFSILELQARIKALFRRMEAMSENLVENKQEKLKFKNLVIDTSKRDVKLSEETLQLTAKEFDLLVHFARHPGKVFTREQLLDSVWNIGFQGYEHTVNSHINRLRAKIETDPANPEYILTVWGVGYKFVDEDN
jgi:DNA-binding response OmpR family regulator